MFSSAELRALAAIEEGAILEDAASLTNRQLNVIDRQLANNVSGIRKQLIEVWEIHGKNIANVNIQQLEGDISRWLGNDVRLLKNKAHDPVFLSKDEMRRVRFDFNKPHPHHSPHMHIEQYVDGQWIGYEQIYPVDLPHK